MVEVIRTTVMEGAPMSSSNPYDPGHSTPGANEGAGGPEQQPGYPQPQAPAHAQYGTPVGAPHDAPGYDQGTVQGPAQRDRQQSKGFFGALFDFSFSHYVTISFAKVIYILGIIVSLLLWIFWIITGFASGAVGFGDYNAVPGILAVVFGWIPVVINILVIRVVLEFAVAMIRTAQNTTDLSQRAVGSAIPGSQR